MQSRSISPDTGQHGGRAPGNKRTANSPTPAGRLVPGFVFVLLKFMKNLSTTSRLSVLACACLSVCAVHAQNTPQPTPQLKEVVITSSRNSQLLTEALPHTTVLNAADIERHQSSDLASLLQKEAGIQITQNGGRGSASSVFVRGAASLQVLVLLDGVPLGKQDASGAVSLEHLALDQVERIEVVRGNVSAIYGSGAIGGVIQIFTKQGGGAPRANLTAELGSRGSRKLSAGVQAGFGVDKATKLSVGVSRQSTDGFSSINPEQQSAANPDSDGYRNQNWSMALSHTLAKGHTLGLRSSHYDGKFDFDSNFDTPADTHTGRTRVDASTLFTENRITSEWLSKFSISQSRDRNSNNYNTAFAYSDAYVTRNRIVNWTNSVSVAKDLLLTAGLEQQRQSVDVDDGFGGLYGRARRVNALFAGLQGSAGSHSLQANVRRDNVPDVGNETTGYLGYGYAITPQVKLLASTSTAFNIAPLGYLYAPFFGNPQLKPEKARSAELGAQWSQDSNVLRATWFRTRSQGQFEYDFTSATFQNIARSKNTGIELSYSGQMGRTELRASLTAQKPVDETTGETLNRRAKSLASLSVSQPIGPWRLGADLSYSGARRDGTKDLDSYTLLNASLRYALSSDVTVLARVENVTNTSYQTVYSYRQAPRGVFVGVNWQPKL